MKWKKNLDEFKKEFFKAVRYEAQIKKARKINDNHYANNIFIKFSSTDK